MGMGVTLDHGISLGIGWIYILNKIEIHFSPLCCPNLKMSDTLKNSIIPNSASLEII
jgi:hypothetical protein